MAATEISSILILLLVVIVIAIALALDRRPRK